MLNVPPIRPGRSQESSIGLVYGESQVKGERGFFSGFGLNDIVFVTYIYIYCIHAYIYIYILYRWWIYYVRIAWSTESTREARAQARCGAWALCPAPGRAFPGSSSGASCLGTQIWAMHIGSKFQDQTRIETNTGMENSF